MNKHRGVLKSFIDVTGNVDVAMVTSQVVNDYKQKQLEAGRKATTINEQIRELGMQLLECEPWSPQAAASMANIDALVGQREQLPKGPKFGR